MRRLTEPELAVLRQWQSRMVVTFVLAMLLVVLLVTLKLAGCLPLAMEYAGGSLFVVLAIWGAYLQFSVKCPSCGYRIGLQCRLVLPRQCPKCNASFRAGDAA